MVHGTTEAEAALAAAPAGGVLLLSAEGAATWPGADAFAAIVARAARTHPGARYAAILDCGAEPGAALHALRRGWRRLVLHPCPASPRVAAAAAALGATVLPARPEAIDAGRLDLRRPGGRALLAEWLAGTTAADAGAGSGDKGNRLG